MRNIDKYSFSLNKYNPINQLIDVFRQQLLKSVVAAEGGGADFSCSMEKNNEDLNRQLLDARMVGTTQKGDAILEIQPQDNLPDFKNEIFRLIEDSFSLVGGETGKGIKTDHYNDENFKQLILVRNEKQKDETLQNNLILAGYRYALIGDSIVDGKLNTPMGSFFDFDQDSLAKLESGRAIELGTAWVNKEIGKRYSIFGLHGIWDGLVYLLDRYQNKYFFGKMTIPSEDAPESYSKVSRDFSIAYLDRFHSEGSFNGKVVPKPQFVYNIPNIDMDLLDVNGSFVNDEQRLKEALKKLDPKNVYGLFPNMFPIYMSRIKRLNYIKTIINGKVCESGIIVDCNEINPEEITSRQSNIYNRNKRFGNSDIRYGDYLDISKSL